jgi:Ca-activated chloride channel family protein
MTRGFVALVMAIAALSLAAILAAQVRVDVRLVNVVATVSDARGRAVPNLTANDFVLEEDGTPQPITHFSQDHNVPVSVGILLDTSGSMERKIRTAVEAVERFTRRIHADDEIFLISFSGQPVLRQDFTDDRDKLSQALRHVNATGGTALYDALRDGLTKIQSGQHHKRAILVLTDGQDTASSTKLEEVLRLIRESELVLYPIGISPLTPAKGDAVDINVLHALEENSGGRAFLLAESLFGRNGQIEKILDTIADELQSQYTLGFYPSRPDDGRYHSLRVRTRAGTVRARRGYIATAS